MRKGISPIVAVVLLIAIAVIAAVGLYFWVGGLATKQPTPSTPTIISAQRVSCTPGTNTTNLTIMVQNLAASGTVNISKLRIVDDAGRQVAPNTTGTISAGGQTAVVWRYGDNDNLTLTAGNTYVLLSTDAGVSQAQVVC